MFEDLRVNLTAAPLIVGRHLFTCGLDILIVVEVYLGSVKVQSCFGSPVPGLLCLWRWKQLSLLVKTTLYSLKRCFPGESGGGSVQDVSCCKTLSLIRRMRNHHVFEPTTVDAQCKLHLVPVCLPEENSPKPPLYSPAGCHAVVCILVQGVVAGTLRHTGLHADADKAT